MALRDAPKEVGESGKIYTALDQLKNDTSNEAKLGFSLDEDTNSLENKFRNAAKDGNIEVLKALLAEKLVGVNCKHPKTKQSALHKACAAEKIEAVEFLLSQEGVEVDGLDSFNNSPSDLAPNTATGKKIKAILKQKTQKVEEDLKPNAKYGEICKTSQLGKYSTHVYICHEYKDNKAAEKIKSKLQELGVVVSMTSGMIPDPAAIKKSVKASKLIMVLGSKDFFTKAKDPVKFARSGCVAELDCFANDRDVSQLIICALDASAKDVGTWMDCEDYASLAEEGVIFDLSNEKAISENIGLLYKEIKMRSLV